MTKCERCGDETNITTMSFFNTDTICMNCEAKERAHPKFQAARDAENEAVRQGDYNFAGIGLPDDLKGK